MTGTAATEAEEFYDIYKLNVVSVPTNKKMLRNDFNDQIFRTELEKYNAITKKIIECNKKGQPVLVGTTSVEKSEKISKFLNGKKIKHNVLNAKQHDKEAKIIAEAGKIDAVTIATNMAGRGTDIKLGGNKDFVEDGKVNDVKQMKEDEKKVKNLGGLFIIGTERHESRRIDNQLRGRSGRQGDPGSSIFFISLQDELMRIFGGDSIDGMLKKLGLKENESIDHPWINKAMERAQKKVETRNFDIRKTLIKFDNVLNDQRQVVFSQRKDAMDSEKIFDYSDNFLSEIVDNLISLKIQKLSNPKNNEFNNKLKAIFGKSLNDNEYEELISLNDTKLREKIFEKFKFAREERSKILGENQSKEIEKRILLQSIDFNWKSHIQYLEQLRQVVGLRSYGQRDPLIEYKKEAFDLFSNLLDKLKLDYVKILMNLKVYNEPTEKINQRQLKEKFKNLGKKTSRNDPCPCGSGKKFKKCCGAL